MLGKQPCAFSFAFYALSLILLLSNEIAADSTDTASTDLGGWPSFSPGIHNWRNALSESIIGKHNVANLRQLWNFTLTSDDYAAPPTNGGFSSVPVSTSGDLYLYVTDWNGNLFAKNRLTGHTLWHFNVSAHVRSIIGTNPFFGAFYASRASPTIVGSRLIVTTQAGALVICLNRLTGAVQWTTQLSSYSLAVITASASYYDGLVYVGLSSENELASALEPFLVEPFQGSFFALNLFTGAIAWTFHDIPASEGINKNFSGGAIWSSLAPIDVKRKQIIISTGNLYDVPDYVQKCFDARFNCTGGTFGTPLSPFLSDPCLAPKDYSQSILALDLKDGSLKWSAKFGSVATWTLACGSSTFPPAVPLPPNCQPANLGVDFDFGQSPVFIPGSSATPDQEDMVAVCQKSGVCFGLSAQAGTVLWATPAAPGGNNGGFQFSSATDGTLLYVADTNSENRNFSLKNGTVINVSHIAALRLKTGAIVWETPSPTTRAGGYLQGVTLANGIVYVSFSGAGDATNPLLGTLLALDATNGQILSRHRYDADFCYPPAINSGVLYLACGYEDTQVYFPPNTLYALTVL